MFNNWKINSLWGSFLCLLLGFVAGKLQGPSIINWYPLLYKSSLTPPNIVFPIAWTILYIFMGTSLGLLIASTEKNKFSLYALFAVQLGLNFLWSVSFFYFQNPLAGLIVIVLLIICIVLYCFQGRQKHFIASILFLPYLGWVCFAAYLNLYIFLHN
ncbi:MAG: TspO/MBR family protein [Candidatus Adiutrix sp.]